MTPQESRLGQLTYEKHQIAMGHPQHDLGFKWRTLEPDMQQRWFDLAVTLLDEIHRMGELYAYWIKDSGGRRL